MTSGSDLEEPVSMASLNSGPSGASSSQLAPTLLTPWGPIEPHRSLRVLAVWAEQGRLYIRLAHEEQTLPEPYVLRSLLRSKKMTVVLLQAPDDWWDRETNDPPQTLVKASGRSRLAGLTPSDFETARSLLQESAEALKGKESPELWDELIADARKTFGNLFCETRPADLGGKDVSARAVSEVAADGDSPHPIAPSAAATSACSAFLRQPPEAAGRLDGYILREALGEGSFSWVFKAAGKDGLASRAVKIAKPAALVGAAATGAGGRTRAIAFTTGGILDVHPDPQQLLWIQFRKLESFPDPALVAVDELTVRENDCYFSMDYIEGRTLRQVAAAGPVPLTVFVEIAEALERLSQLPGFNYHGDLKPDNIMISPSGKVTLLDPGHFGPLDCLEGDRFVTVTTPGYYPLLRPDDLLALGILLWETACGAHPLDGRCSIEEISLARVEADLANWVCQAQAVGQHFLVPLLDTGRPSQACPHLAPAADAALLKGLRLTFNESGKLARAPGYGSFSELAEALRQLIAGGIEQF